MDLRDDALLVVGRAVDDGGRLSGDKKDTGGDGFEPDPDRNALGETNPAERRIDPGNGAGAVLPLLVVNGPADRFDSSPERGGRRP